MALKERKITEAGISAHGVTSAPDRLTGTAAENKKVFDNLVREVVAEAVNGIVDELTGESGAEQIGMKAVEGMEGRSVQEGFSELLGKLQRWEKEITGAVINVPVDEAPTEGSRGVPSSGGTWAAIQGLAPSGYGIGEEAPGEAESADEALLGGWYIVPDFDGGDKKMLLFVESMSESCKKQTVHRFAGGSMKRSMTDGTWGAWVGTERVGDIVLSSRNMEVETDGLYIALDGRTVDTEAYPVANLAGHERVPEPTRHFAGAELTTAKNIGIRSLFLDGTMLIGDYANDVKAIRPDETIENIRASSNALWAMKICQGQILSTTNNSGFATTVSAIDGTVIRGVSTGNGGKYIYTDGEIAIYDTGTALRRTTDNFATYITALGASTVGPYTAESSLHRPIEKYGENLYLVDGATVYRSADNGIVWQAAFTITTDLGDIVATTSSYNKHFIHNGYLYLLCSVASTVRLLKVNLESGACEGYTDALEAKGAVENKKYLCGTVYGNTAYCAYNGNLLKIDLETMHMETWEPYPGVTTCVATQDIFTTHDLMFISTGTTVIPTYHNADATGAAAVCIVYDLRTGKSAALYNSYGWDINGMVCEDDVVYFTAGTYDSGKYTDGALYKIDLKQRVLPEVDFGYIKAMEG